jgi:hypothetical protein
MHRAANSEQLFADLPTMISMLRDDAAVVALVSELFRRGAVAAAWFALSISCGFVSPPALRAQQTRLTEGEAAGETAVVLDVMGTTHRGALLALDGDSLTIGGAQPVRLSRRDLISLRFPGRKPTAPLPRTMVFLGNGDRLAVDPELLEGDKLTARWSDFRDAPPVVIPMETIRGLHLNLPQTPFAQRQAMGVLLDRRESNDVVLLANDDQFSGELKAMDKAYVTLSGTAGESRVDRGRVVWIGMNTELISFPKVEGPTALVALTDGSKITARAIQAAENGQIRVEAAFGGTLSVPAASVERILFRGGRVTYLSDLEATEYEFTPFLATKWPLRIDQAVDGGPLVVRGVEYLKGLGTHSRSRVRYALVGIYRQFRSLAGIVDSAGGQGNVKFAVEVDGRRVFESAELTGRDAAVEIGPMDMRGAKKLELIVEFGEHGDVLDRANWCEPLLVK